MSYKTVEGFKRKSFALPRIWREPTNHHDDCYFCMVDVSKYTKGKYNTGRQTFDYPNTVSYIAPVSHDKHLPTKHPPIQVSILVLFSFYSMQ